MRVLRSLTVCLGVLLCIPAVGQLTAPQNSFEVENSGGDIVAFISDTGDFDLIGFVKIFASQVSELDPMNDDFVVRNSAGVIVARLDPRGRRLLQASSFVSWKLCRASHRLPGPPANVLEQGVQTACMCRTQHPVSIAAHPIAYVSERSAGVRTLRPVDQQEAPVLGYRPRVCLLATIPSAYAARHLGLYLGHTHCRLFHHLWVSFL